MHLRAGDLKEFYDSPGGRVVQRILRGAVKKIWPDIKGLRVLGLGYAMPYLKHMTQDAERVTALMPEQMGAIFWPPNEKGMVALCHEGALPIETNSIDRMLVVHGLSGADSLDDVLSEAWRVLKGQGSLVIMVPNRTGLWARFDHTPFGHGTPWSVGQLRDALKSYMFVPERTERALYVPPTSSRLWLATAPLWEKIGPKLFGAFGGVNIIEASKQIYAGTPVGVASQNERRRIIPSPKPLSRSGEIR